MTPQPSSRSLYLKEQSDAADFRQSRESNKYFVDIPHKEERNNRPCYHILATDEPTTAESGEPESETAPTPQTTSPAPSVDKTVQPEAKMEPYEDFADDISDKSVDPAPPGSEPKYHGYTLATLEMMKGGEEGKNSAGTAPEVEAASAGAAPEAEAASAEVEMTDSPHNYTSSVGPADPHEREPSQQETQPPQTEHRARTSYRSPWIEDETTTAARPSPPPPIPGTTSSGFLRSPHAQELRAATTSGPRKQSPQAHENQPPAMEHKTPRAATLSPPPTRDTRGPGFLQSPHAQDLRAATTIRSDIIPRTASAQKRQTSRSNMIPRSAWAVGRKSRGGGGDGSCSLKHAREKKAEMRTRLKEKQDKTKVRFVLSGKESASGSGSGSGLGSGSRSDRAGEDEGGAEEKKEHVVDKDKAEATAAAPVADGGGVGDEGEGKDKPPPPPPPSSPPQQPSPPQPSPPQPSPPQPSPPQPSPPQPSPPPPPSRPLLAAAKHFFQGYARLVLSYFDHQFGLEPFAARVIAPPSTVNGRGGLPYAHAEHAEHATRRRIIEGRFLLAVEDGSIGATVRPPFSTREFVRQVRHGATPAPDSYDPVALVHDLTASEYGDALLRLVFEWYDPLAGRDVEADEEAAVRMVGDLEGGTPRGVRVYERHRAYFPGAIANYVAVLFPGEEEKGGQKGRLEHLSS
ncbi:hypothetical protein B0T26DRAFT_758451 [Lasiosphaeria miniovina]|uniref:Uncharacterized protein n=1 Tax=Lasiosphaeria miniovina TaxID=1954250 RepID=A0AA40BEZ3_9PEZI|nr:uncharacterized protein B0T26DRAFT_758451 [Lasiosphaeria miniovina]KAK0733018.1 hypothetical protein B0T26DRAFT_758451 [Lasiosphaeria miniovina]